MPSDPNGWPGPATIERFARIIDPEAFGLPSHVPTCGADYLTDRDEARDKAKVLLAEVAPFITAYERVAVEAVSLTANLRAAWLRVIQTENSCDVTGKPCHAKRCGCVREQDMLIKEADDAK